MKRILTLFVFINLLFVGYASGQTITYPGNTPAGFCQGGSILLTASNPPVGASFVWEKSILATGPWVVTPGSTAVLSVNTIGYYRVKVSTLVPVSTVIYDSVQVIENANPVPSFNFAPSNQCGTVPVLFTNTTSGAVSYVWNFGDIPSGGNNTSTAINPVHRFVGVPGNATQNFTVTQTATSAQGCIASTTRTVTTTQLPDASLNGTGYSVVNGIKYFKKCTNSVSEVFSFQNLSTTTATNTNYQIIWGDGTPDYNSTTFPLTPALTHTYGIGVTPLMFIVTGQNGCKDTTNYNVFLGNNPSVGLGNPGNTAICTSNTLTFPLSGTATNTAGTIYTVSFSDGSPNLTFSQPPPAFVTHIFNTTSCGTNINPSYPNAFAVVIVASNPCASSQASVVPIYVSQKPTPAITISPKDTICLATSLTVANTSGLSSSNDNGVCTPGKQIWSITPATGWVLNSGSFGNNLNSNDPALWLNGSTSLNFTFNTVGTYTIKMIIGNTFCGIDSIIKTICVNPNPIANFSIDNLTGCTPLTVNTTNNSNTPFCGTNKYLWTVNYTPTAGCTPNTSLFNYLNGTNANSTAPQFQFINPGTYTINLQTITPGGICTSAVAIKTVIVKAKPIVTIPPLTNICQNIAFSPTANASCNLTGATTYLWTFPVGTPSSANTASPGSIVFSNAGGISISLDVTNECGTTTASQPITINPQPDFTAPPNIAFCAGDITTAYSFSSTPAGASFTWTNSNTAIGLAASGNTTIPVFTATNSTAVPITATINITALQGGCTRTRSFIITVNPRPLAPIVTTPIAYCQNETATALVATASTGNTLLWYATATGGIGSTTAPVPSTASIGALSYYVSQISTAYNCESPRVAIVVNVNAIPVITNLNSTQPTACGVSDGTISFAVPSASTAYTVKYLKNGVLVTLSITSSVSNIITITNLGVGIYSDIFVTQNACPSNMLGPVTLSNPNPPATPVIANVNPLCSGSALNLSASSATPGVTYLWSGPLSFTSTIANPSIPNATVANAGTYAVVTTLAGCVSVAATVVVVIDQTPALPIASNNGPLCAGATLNLSANSSTPGVTYAWTGVGGYASAAQYPIIANSTVAMSGIYTVIATNTTSSQACPSAPANTTVLIKPVPNIIDSSATNPTACATATGTILLNGLAANTSYIINYSFNNVPQTALNLPSSPTGLVTMNALLAGTYSNITATLNGCVSNIAGPFTLLNPTPPNAPTINSNSPLCSGNTLNLTATSSTAGAIFSWTGPSSFTSNIASPTIPNVNVTNTGVYTVIATIAGCASSPVQVNVVVNQTPITPTVTSNSPICTGNALILNAATTTPGSMTFAWTGPNGFTSASQNPSITNATQAASGLYSVTFTSVLGNCPSAIGSTTAIVNPTPVITNGTFTNPTACASATGSITLNGLTANTAYTVQYSNNVNVPVSILITTNASGAAIVTGLVAGTYTGFSVSILGCVSNTVGPFTLVNPNPPITPLATNNGALCVGYNLQLNANTSSVGAATYAWTGPNGFTSGLQNPTITNITAANAGLYSVTVTINNCTSAAGTTTLVVNPLAVLPIVSSPVNYCIGAPTVALTANAASGHTLSWYNTLIGGTALSAAPTPSSLSAGTTNYFVSQTTALGCEGARATIQVIINPDAKAIFTPTNTINCAPFNITTAIVGLQQFPLNNSIYQWYANNILIGTGTNFPGYTILNQNDSVTIKLKAISLFGCKDDSMSIKFFTYIVPAPSFTLSDTVGCGPLSVSFVNTTPNIGLYNYNWNFGNGITSTLQQPGSVIFATNPTFNDTTYIVKLTVSSVCNVIVFQKSIRIKSKPKALYTADRTSGCSPMRVLFTNTSKGLNNTYYWEFNDGSPTFITTSRAPFTHIFFTGVVTNYNVRLIAENECGRDTISYTLTVAPNNIQLLYSINGPDRYGCAPHTVAFFNNSNGASSFQWDFGDGNTLATTQNVQTVYHTYLTAGDYTVTLTAANNCTDTFALKQITVYPKPTAAFNTSVSNACIGQSIQMNNTSSSATSYLWDFGDNTPTSNLFNPNHTYTAPGPYTIRLIIYRVNPSGNVCTDTTTRLIQITSSLPGNFTQTATSGTCAPLTVTFVNQIRPSVTAVWNFGDGGTATGDSVVHTYLAAGLFNVSLTVTVAGGCTYTKTSTVNLLGPLGTFQYTSGYICYPNAATFTAAASNTNNFIWNFGDGIIQTTPQNIVTHNYANPGVYVPSVTLQNAAGCNVPIAGVDTIKVDRIIKGFKSVQQNSCGSTLVNFTDTSFAFFGKAQVKWRFGDGGIGTGSLISHSYAATGSYNVEMIVIGNSGCTDTTKKVIDVLVNNYPIVGITAPLVKCTNDSVLFQSNVVSADLLNPMQWKIMPNGATFNGNNFTYLFNTAGTYTVRLIAGTVNGCFDTAFHTITINAAPTITTSPDLNLCKGNTTQLNVSGALTYQWTPTIGLSCTTCFNPFANPITSTVYTVTGTNAAGCSNSRSIIITVIQPTNITVSPDAKICIGQTVNLLAVGATNYLWDNAQTLTSTTISNPTANPTVTTVYTVIGYDSYNCFADTAYVQVGVGRYPTVNLGSDVTLATGTNLPLTTVITNGPITQWLWNPATDLSCSTCPLPIATIKKDITYRVKVTTEYGCSASDTINIKTFCEAAQVFIPKAFTPDGDGLNDILMVRGTGIASVKYFRIFNRWGELIFERNNFAPNNPTYGWDGKIRGIVGPPDVFVYTAEVICENGSSYTYKGNTASLK